MTLYFGYHAKVRRIGISALFLALTCAPALQAQLIHGIPPSVTSISPDRPNINVPPSVTSLGINPLFPRSPSLPLSHRHHAHHRLGTIPYYYAVPVYVPYYAGDYGDPNAAAADEAADEDYRGGPTIFDRRGPGPSVRAPDYRPTENRAALDGMDSSATKEPTDKELDQRESADTTPASDEPATVMVFKDGHQVEVKNYVIQGDQLYDLSTRRPRKIALADLNLAATQKLNDDRGIDFQIPAHAGGN